MTEKELKFMLSEGEGLFVEFKERPDKSLAREIVAFANASGGRIFLGVSDDARMIGIEIDNRLRSQIQDMARNCDPAIPVQLETVDSVLVVDVPESVNKPHACSDGFFMRIGANSQKMSRDEVFAMGICSGHLRFDEQICAAFAFPSDIDANKVAAYLSAAGLPTDLPLHEILINLEVLREVDGRLSMTNAGVLMFGKDPSRFLKSAPIVCAVYQGENKVDILDRKIYNDGLIGNIDSALTYLKRHIDVRFEIDSFKRREIPQYPEEAVREAVVNALLHRDYFDASGDVMVEIFRNHIKVSNPGGLVPWLRKEDFGKYSRTRNRLLASLLMRTIYVEKMGTGVLRIDQALKEAGLPEAEFSFDAFSFSITLHATEHTIPQATEEVSLDGALSGGVSGALSGGVSGGVSGGINELLVIISKNPGKRSGELCGMCNMSNRTVERRLKELKDLGLVEFRGAPKTGGYYVVNNSNVEIAQKTKH